MIIRFMYRCHCWLAIDSLILRRLLSLQVLLRRSDLYCWTRDYSYSIYFFKKEANLGTQSYFIERKRCRCQGLLSNETKFCLLLFLKENNRNINELVHFNFCFLLPIRFNTHVWERTARQIWWQSDFLFLLRRRSFFVLFFQMKNLM